MIQSILVNFTRGALKAKGTAHLLSDVLSAQSVKLVWDELDRKINAKKTANEAHLRQLLQESSANLFSVYLESLVKRICGAVIATNESHFYESKVYEIFEFFGLICT